MDTGDLVIVLQEIHAPNCYILMQKSDIRSKNWANGMAWCVEPQSIVGPLAIQTFQKWGEWEIITPPQVAVDLIPDLERRLQEHTKLKEMAEDIA